MFWHVQTEPSSKLRLILHRAVIKRENKPNTCCRIPGNTCGEKSFRTLCFLEMPTNIFAFCSSGSVPMQRSVLLPHLSLKLSTGFSACFHRFACRLREMSSRVVWWSILSTFTRRREQEACGRCHKPDFVCFICINVLTWWSWRVSDTDTNLTFLHQGVSLTAQRAAIVVGVELPVYDITKKHLILSGVMGDTVYTHFL